MQRRSPYAAAVVPSLTNQTPRDVLALMRDQGGDRAAQVEATVHARRKRTRHHEIGVRAGGERVGLLRVVADADGVGELSSMITRSTRGYSSRTSGDSVYARRRFSR
jgi:hypothetical protein